MADRRPIVGKAFGVSLAIALGAQIGTAIYRWFVGDVSFLIGFLACLTGFVVTWVVAFFVLWALYSRLQKHA